jgi:hypothetical protein
MGKNRILEQKIGKCVIMWAENKLNSVNFRNLWRFKKL